MGFYIRKSVSFGPVRFNLSKSGIGVSVGVKGFRYGISPRGSYIHMGRGGLYYKTMLTKKTASQPRQRETEQPQYIQIESADAARIVDSSSEELVNELTKQRKKVSFWLIGVFCFLALSAISSVWAIGLVTLVPVLAVIDYKRKTSLLFYDIDRDKEQSIQEFYDSMNEIMSAKRKWHIQATSKVTDWKRNAGASQFIKRIATKVKYGTPRYIKTNVKVPMIQAGDQKLYFFPDQVLIFQRRSVGAVDYSNLEVYCRDSRFIEEGHVPSDARVVDHTWKFVNAKGGPDRRFSNNRKIPIVLYAEVCFQSPSGLNVVLQFSRYRAGYLLQNSLSNFAHEVQLEENQVLQEMAPSLVKLDEEDEKEADLSRYSLIVSLDEMDWEMYFEAIEVVLNRRQASVSSLQRSLRIGYTRAARMIDQMEGQGLVGPYEGELPRKILLSRKEWALLRGQIVNQPESDD
ncbi:DUF4236 domain-containing protein [Cohnella sp. GCM10027633]|uniref:DUF4236 domain-containing protein n=1 Tax=unclassified Cohnella TaxID=2636738 RepID=UPI003624F94A